MMADCAHWSQDGLSLSPADLRRQGLLHERIMTPEAADALPAGSVIADVTEPDAPATACKAARGDWQFLGEDPERRYWSSEILPANKCRIILLWRPEWGARRG